jgi:Ca-activated chloride channel homolog
MRTNSLIGKFLACLAGSAILINFALAQATDDKTSTEARPQSDTRSDNGSRAQIQIPNRPSRSLFQGEQGNQKTEISFDPATQLVTVKMLVQDPNGYFIPNIRRDNFAVYEDGIRQHNATVEIEHSPVSVAMLLEWGGRYSAFNKALADDVPRVAYQMLDELGRQDKIAVFRYGDRLERLADFSTGHEDLEELLTDFDRPEFSELNFYDALVSTLNYMKPVSGRKAVVLISSGVDTFSKTRYEDVLRAARDSGTPVYAVNIGPKLREAVQDSPNQGPYARIDWNHAQSSLQEIAKASGGRMYSPASIFDVSGVYDDIMENLRVRYVITYKSPSNRDPGLPRTVRVELVDSKTGGPLQVVDTNGKIVPAKIFVQDSYTPRAVSMSHVNTSALNKPQE